MPAVNPGRVNVNAAGKSTGKRRVKRRKDRTAGPPKPKPRVTVAPADRVAERVEARKQQIKRSVSKSPDRQDTKRSPAQVKRDAQVVAENVKTARAKVAKTRRRAAIDARLKAGPKVSKSQAAVAAPVLKVLEQTTRPLHAIAAATDEALHGGRVGTIGTGASPGSVLKAAGRGLKNEDKTTFSDVIKGAGVKNKAVAGVGGFALDVAADPTTYVTFGTGSVASKAAAQAGKKAEKKALKAGLTSEQAQRMGERAAKQAGKTADQTKGATVQFAGKEVPGVRKATAKASKPARAAARKVVPERVREGGRAAGADVNPDVAPAGVSRETSRKAVQATRTARSKSNRGVHEAQQQGAGIKQQIGEADYGRVIDAIENGTIGKLPPELRDVAVRIRSQFRHANRQRKQAGIRGGEVGGKKARGRVKEYIPHRLTDEALEEMEKPTRASSAVGRKTIRPSSSKARTEQAPLSELRLKHPGRYSEDLPNLYAGRKAEGATAAARAELNRRIADLGTPVRKGQDLELGANDAVFHITGSDISAPLKRKEVERLLDSGSHEGPMRGRYVVLNKDIVKRAVEGAQPTLEGPGIIRGYDKVQGGFKRLALATPGFHVRNLVGDTQNAYLGQSGRRLPRNMVQAGRVLKAEGRRDKSLRDLAQGNPGSKTVDTKRYGKVTYDEVAEHLTQHGGMRTGYTARELPELAGEAARVRRLRLPRKAKQALLNREDLPRVTTAIDALKKGATWEEAAQRVADYHFDYGHLTRFERNVGRRALPFYTFTARNIPRQFKSLASNPGKFANYQKLIEETAKATGMDEEAQKHRAFADQLRRAGVKLPEGWEAMMSEWEQRNAGVPISWRGQKFTVSFGLPLAQGLNEVPGAAGKKQMDEYFKTAMSLVSPIIKNPVEYFNNYSFFFRDQIERDQSPLVSAPSYVKDLPASVRKDMGIVQGVDKRTGKLIWRWPGKVDYIVKTVPGLPQYAQSLTTEGTNRRGKGTGGKALQLFGVRAEPFDPDRTLTNLAYERVGEIQKRQAALRQSVNPRNGKPVSADNPTAEYSKLSRQLKIAQRAAYQGQEKQGYKVLPKLGAPKKVKVQKGFDFSSGGQDFDFAAGGQSFDFGG